MTFTFGHHAGRYWIEYADGPLDVSYEELVQRAAAHGIKIVTPVPAEPSFRPAMELGFDDCDPVAACQCGARCKGDSINDALTAWGKHLTTVHRGQW